VLFNCFGQPLWSWPANWSRPTNRFTNTTSMSLSSQFQIKKLTSSSIRDTQSYRLYFTDFNKQLFVLSTCFDLHFETVILTTPTQQKISHTKTYAPGRSYTRSQRNVPLLLHSNTHSQEEGCSVTNWWHCPVIFLHFLFCFVLSLQCKGETHVNVQWCRGIMFEKTQSLFTF
jgi:hypothetical protein